ncbi:hypothetical protein Ahy_A05g022346 [Arachis hypogaea]|uniref:Uncharacterized protein n=1 Tax=Arachis hypogaea TaxID=3818 RepID=A0A445D0A4_ARAHY|nr:hypothetical protein Ahy_A05g022346 [Arachis hypogaea]
MSFIEFEQSEANQNIERKDCNSDSEEEFESNCEVVGPDGDEDQADGSMEADVTLANQYPFEEPSLMCALDLEAMHTPKFLEYMNAAELFVVVYGKFVVGIEFSFREAAIMSMKNYTICRESNFLRKFKAPYLQKLIVNIVPEYEMCYQRLRERGEAYTHWLNRIPREQYVLAFDGGYRWDHMTMNMVECINSILKGVYNLPMTALVKTDFTDLMSYLPRKESRLRLTLMLVIFF